MKTKLFADAGSATVLVVDDQKASRSILAELLHSITPKPTIIQKSHPQEALDWAVHHSVDLVLVDFIMPEMNGIHFTRVLRTIQTYQYIPIVMVTIVDDKETKQQALEAGVTDYLCKPLNLQECIVRCQNLLSLQHQQAHLSEERSALASQLNETKYQVTQFEHEVIQLLTHLIYQTSTQLLRARRIAHYAKLLAEVCGLNTQEQLQLEQASMLFEIDSLQCLGSQKTQANQTAARDMATASNALSTSIQLMSQSHSALFRMAAEIAKCYRDYHLVGEDEQQHNSESTPLTARVVAVAAYFDQLSFPFSNTVHAEPPSVANALAQMASNTGDALDANLVKQLISIRPRLEKVYEEYIANKTS